LLTLKVRTKCSFIPLARQTRLTIERLVPSASAGVRVLQWVVSAGFCCVVISMVFLTSWSRVLGGRPRGEASFSIPGISRWASRLRQRTDRDAGDTEFHCDVLVLPAISGQQEAPGPLN